MPFLIRFGCSPRSHRPIVPGSTPIDRARLSCEWPRCSRRSISQYRLLSAIAVLKRLNAAILAETPVKRPANALVTALATADDDGVTRTYTQTGHEPRPQIARVAGITAGALAAGWSVVVDVHRGETLIGAAGDWLSLSLLALEVVQIVGPLVARAFISATITVGEGLGRAVAAPVAVPGQTFEGITSGPWADLVAQGRSIMGDEPR